MRKAQYKRFLVILACVICFALGMGAKLLYSKTEYMFLGKLSIYSLKTSYIIAGLVLLEWLVSNKIYKGIRYFWRYHTVKNSLELQMIDAGLFIERGNVLELPVIKLRFERHLTSGVLRIRNSLKFDKKLDDIVMSSALKRYIVERHYTTDDSNYYVYEIIDGSSNYKIEFKSYEEYQKYCEKIPTYSVFLDDRSIVKLQHTLLVGVTGSGKTYCLYNFILQFFNKSVPYELYYADPKGSSLAVIGQTVAPDKTAVGMEQIIEKLEEFVFKMRERKEEIKELLKSRLDADYSNFDKSPYIFCFDEYASFVSVLANEDKKTRDKVNSLMSEVVLQGRQLGFFMLIIMQKSDANLISTSLRDNIPLKIVLGNSEKQTYVTAFGTGVVIPNRHYKIGEGVFTEPGLAQEPKLVQCPYLNFDILGAVINGNPRDVITGVAEKE